MGCELGLEELRTSGPTLRTGGYWSQERKKDGGKGGRLDAGGGRAEKSHEYVIIQLVVCYEHLCYNITLCAVEGNCKVINWSRVGSLICSR